MKKYIICTYIVFLIINVIAFINPYYEEHFMHIYDGGDISIFHFEISLILLIISAVCYVFHKSKREDWLFSMGLAIFNLIVISPLIFFYLFFGIPFLD
ncbi:hypothetical protein [Staphylococcus hyicus]|uniref:Uncharacterized protein n=1 Tax=Staphylococcus hyicus TaxID=1284 RepID=A0ACD5FNL3_STAHY|nr:hypothetical protein [Staphylococcus hyicus]AJC95614.1 hypothetical protein SHYC_04125 [Staphylococcus hyicus]MCE5154713.1 hypothetical protein [Staphylococcus hyicus]MCQ9301642.1 hypothetical protein [Staphylococcus hyicus]MDP4463868.1 hypothetical protein [Staphylococcus hyicus]MDP4469540.1 hypothetical protein [Staphylococcus hyicus]